MNEPFLNEHKNEFITFLTKLTNIDAMLECGRAPVEPEEKDVIMLPALM